MQGCIPIITAAALENNRQQNIGKERNRAVYVTFSENIAMLDSAAKIACSDSKRYWMTVNVRKFRTKNQALFDQGFPLPMNQFSYCLKSEIEKVVIACGTDDLIYPEIKVCSNP